MLCLLYNIKCTCTYKIDTRGLKDKVMVVMKYSYGVLVSKATVFVLMMTFCTAIFADDREKHIGKGVEALPLFDAHVHYKEPAWGPYPPATIVEMMDKSGVAMALVSSTPDEGTIKLWKYAPSRIVPELRPYHGQAGSSNWTKVPGMFDYLVKRLNDYPHEGIGEFHLHNVDPGDEALLRKISELAISKNIYIHVHSGKEPVELLFSLEPKLKIIWAHAGMSEPAETVEEMMATYKTLYADTSFREGDILTPQGTIDPAWRRVLERFPDRFMVGSDTWVNAQWDSYGEIMSINRRWLSQFSRPIAEKIAFRNAERLFGRKVENSLIGKR
jgi:Amidohydrolase